MPEPRVAEPGDRRLELALRAASLRASAVVVPCPASLGADGCLAVPAVLDERFRTDAIW